MRAKNFLASGARLCGAFFLMWTTLMFAQSESRDAKAGDAATPSSITTTTIPATLFGMSSHSDVLFGTPWPSMPISAVRLWDTNTGWGQINTANGVYDWTTLDLWVTAAAAHNVQLVYAFGVTPTWASSKSNDTTCDYMDGACDPPSDLNADGTGTDQHFIDFVSAIAQHAPSITYWEMWNTPHDILQWTGTDAQLVRMTKDANTYIKKYIPTAKIISPANGQLNYNYPSANCTMADKMGGYLAAGLGKYVDIIGLHTYYTTVPENIVPVVQCYQSTMATYNVGSLPLWSTEGAWGTDTELPSTSDQAGFLARLYLLLWSNGVPRHFWYSWDDITTGTLSNDGVSNSVGKAYTQVEAWMSGRTMSTLCSANTAGIWTCGLTGPNGYAAQAVWHPGGNKSYTAPTKYINYLDLGGSKHNISKGATVTVGTQPILLQNQAVVTGNPNFLFSETGTFPVVKAETTGTSGALTITAQDGFSGAVNLSCLSTFGSGSCSVSPTSVSKYPATVNLIINGTSFAAGTYELAVQGISGSITNTFNVAFNVADFSVTGPGTLASLPSGTAAANVTLSSLFTYSGQVNNTCDASAIAGATCTLSPANPVTITNGGAEMVTANISVPGSATAGTYSIKITSADASGVPTHTLTIPYSVSDFALAGPATLSGAPGGTAVANLTVSSLFSYNNKVNATCDSSALSSAVCTLSPANPVAVGTGASVPLIASVTVPSTAAGGVYNVVVTTTDISGAPAHSLTIPLTVGQTVQDFSFGSPTPSTQTVTSGQSAAYTFNVLPVGSSFAGNVTLSCTGVPALTQCSFSPASVTPGSTSATSVMTITTTAASAASVRRVGIALFLPTSMGLPGLMMLFAIPRRRKKGRASLVLGVAALVMLALIVTSCGAAAPTSSSQTGGGGTHQGTQPGTYTITVTGTSGTITHQATAVTLIVN